MTDWSAGYVTDIGYTFGYYAELNPQRLALPLLAAGIVPPKVESACELGFGQGMSVNIHAAASTASWWGTDFNPSQAGFAQELAGVSTDGKCPQNTGLRCPPDKAGASLCCVKKQGERHAQPRGLAHDTRNARKGVLSP